MPPLSTTSPQRKSVARSITHGARAVKPPGVTSVAVEEREQTQLLTIQSPRGLELTHDLHGFLDGARIGRIAAREPTLEDAYVALVTEAER